MVSKKLAGMIHTALIITTTLLMSCRNNPHDRLVTDDTLNKPPVVKTIPDSISKFAWKPVVYDSNKQYIYLTFDDGPQHGTTAVFDLCRKLGVKASFFMVGEHATDKREKEIVATIRNAYPQSLLCNHSTTHANGHYNFFYHHADSALKDFLLAQQTLRVPYQIIRLPGNSAWVKQGQVKASKLVDPVCLLLDSAGYNIIGWDVEWSFNHKTANPVQTPEKMIAIVDSTMARKHTHTSNHLVILSHDRMFRNPNYTDSLARFIELLKQNPNYVFETVDHYPGLKQAAMQLK